MSASPPTFIWADFFSVTSILSCWLPHTTTMRTLLTSQTAWPWCGTWSTRSLHRSTSSTVRYPKTSFSRPSPRSHWWLLPWQAWNTTNQPLFAPSSLLLLSSAPTPLTLLPSPTSWVHRTGIHLHHIYPQTHVREAPEKTCGAAGVEWNPSTAAGLSVWGRAGYHVHLNKGPVFRRASRESSRAPPLCPALL